MHGLVFDLFFVPFLTEFCNKECDKNCRELATHEILPLKNDDFFYQTRTHEYVSITLNIRTVADENFGKKDKKKHTCDI